ncbi:MAG: oligosaccharide flippase family protein [Methyloglobulus sp.]|nr:oligosaccharide flippase family protein [Methyloglobulus sp.]
MGIIKKLASQTAIYGLSSIFGRFLNYSLVPLHTRFFSAQEYGVVSEFYAYAGFFSVLLLFGFETGYFRFRNKELITGDKTYSTALWFILLVNVAFFAFIFSINHWLSSLLNYPEHPEYVLCFSLILILDAISAIPFARLRAEEKAFRFAGIKIAEILIIVALNLLFLWVCPKLYANKTFPLVTEFYDPTIGVGYIFIANLVASVFKFILLMPQLLGLRWGFDITLFKRLLCYSLPMVVIGFAGIINEMLDRVLLKQLLPYDLATNMKMLGIYSACYKLSILMSLFIQAFRFAAEPFFFAYADKSDARPVYAKVLRFFVIFCVFIFLLVTLFLDFFKYFVGEEFRSGLDVVPVLLLANLCLGIYVNLSIWYKLTDHTLMGALVALCGAALTVYLNIQWIPLYGYMGSAWATLACYGSMAVVSYLLGQIYYPVNYNVLRILAYIGLGLGLYQANLYLKPIIIWEPGLLALALLSLYLLTAMLFENRYLAANK